MDIRPITSAEARTVHLPVRGPDLPPEAAAFDGTRLIGVATFFPEPCPLTPGPRAWRIHGMAMIPEKQGCGGGRLLVAEGIRVARADSAERMWCNARVSAQGFYEKLGFTTCGDEFVLPVAGPHYVMTKDLREPS